MKNLIKMVCFFVLSGFLNAQLMKEIYKNPDFNSLSAGHQKVAIIPFNVTVGAKALEEMRSAGTYDELKRQLEAEGRMFQSSIYSRFLKKSKNYTIKFQDIDRTNALIRKAGISFSDLEFADMTEIASVLKVDAVIVGNVFREKGMSQGGAVAMAILIGSYGATGTAKMNLKIFNGKDGDKLWQYTHRAKGGLGTNIDDIVLRLMKQVSRKFPYRKAY